MSAPTPSLASDTSSLAVILLSRGGVGAASRKDMTELSERLQAALLAAQMHVTHVQPAYVDRAHPALPEALDACSGAQTVLIVPVMLPDEAALRRWLHKLIMRWRAAQGAPPRLVFADPLIHTPQWLDMLVRSVQQAPSQPDVPTVMGDDPWENDPTGWSSVPEHQHHVLWCVGPRCAARGAVQLWPKLAETIRETPELKKRVMPLQTSCQYPCNHGPLMIIYPEGVWYGPITEENMARVLVEQVVQGTEDAALRVHGPGAPRSVEEP